MLLLLLFDKRKIARAIRSQQKKLLKKKREFIDTLQFMSDMKLYSEKQLLDQKSYYMKISKKMNRLCFHVLDEFKKSNELFPQIIITKKVIALLNDINEIQKSQQHVMHFISSSADAAAAAALPCLPAGRQNKHKAEARERRGGHHETQKREREAETQKREAEKREREAEEREEKAFHENISLDTFA